MSEKFLLLDSKDNENYGANSSDCIFHLYGLDFEGVNYAELLNFSCPLTMYNVNSSNNVIYFNDSVARTATLTPSNYDVYSLIAAIDVAMNASPSALTFVTTYSDELMKITVTGSAAFTFTFGTNTTNSAATIMGFNNADTASAIAQTGPNVINLSIPLYIYIRVEGFAAPVRSSNPYDNATFCVSTIGNNSDVLTWTPGTFYQQKVTSYNHNVTEVRVTLRSYNNNAIDLNGSNWSMLLKLTA
jgi:hypothetical protein